MINIATPKQNARLIRSVRQALRPEFAFASGRALRSYRPAAAKIGATLAAAACGWLMPAGGVQAQVWTPLNNNYNDAGNWTPMNVPDMMGETAIFGAAAITNPTVNTDIAPEGFTFTLAAPAYTITNLASLTFVGTGIVNNSAFTQTLNVDASAFLLEFQNASSAGNNVVINNDTNFVNFLDDSTAAGSTINNQGGILNFADDATAGASTIDNSTTAFSGLIGFANNSDAGTATITNSGIDSLTFFTGTASAEQATIFNDGTNSSTTFGDSATAADSFILNTGDFSIISFGDTSSAGNSLLTNDANTFAFILFTGNSTAETALITNLNADGVISFFDSSTAGRSTIVNAGLGAPGASSIVTFANNSTASSSLILNIGTNTVVSFGNSSTAGAASIINSGDGSYTEFVNTASGGTAALANNNPTAFIDISQLTSPGTTAGSIEGNGALYLGSKNLAVGGNNLSTTFSGIIQDLGIGGGVGGSLTKVGLGTLTLTAANTYTGNTTVDRGSLIINGSIVSPNTTVNGDGLLGGTGRIGGNLLNRGTVRPGNTPSGLTVVGNFTQTNDGDLRIAIASNSTFGKLRVGGTANVNGSVSAVSVDGFRPKRGDTFTFLTADGGVNGRFDDLNTTGFGNTILQLGLVYDADSVSLEFQQGSFRDFADRAGFTRNQKSVASALDKIAFNRGERRLIEFLNERSLDRLADDFDRIAPEEMAAIFEIGISLANVQNTNIQRRTDDLRQGASGFSAAGLAMQGSGPGYSGTWGAAGPTGSEGKESKNFVAPPDKKWGAFLTGVGEWIDVGDTRNARGYDITTGGFTLGVDYKIAPNFALGVTAGYAGTGADLTNDGHVLVNSGKLGLYATYFTGGFYVDAAAAGGYNNYDTKRQSVRGTARGDTEGGEFNALIGGGYDFKLGAWTIGPTASVQYTYLQIKDFTEHGSLADLHIEDQEQESLRTAIGFRTSYDIKLRNGIVIRPEIRASWQHEFGDREFEIDSRFASSSDGNFTVRGPRTGRDSLLLGVGAALQLNDRTAIYLYYDGQLARSEYESHSISGGIRVAF